MLPEHKRELNTWLQENVEISPPLFDQYGNTHIQVYKDN
jgi:hypothetical protein